MIYMYLYAIARKKNINESIRKVTNNISPLLDCDPIPARLIIRKIIEITIRNTQVRLFFFFDFFFVFVPIYQRYQIFFKFWIIFDSVSYVLDNVFRYGVLQCIDELVWILR